MKAAAKRQMEFEKVQERKIQKEREEEGDLWSDKETFVTSAYRKKMEERQLLEEEERNQGAMARNKHFVPHHRRLFRHPFHLGFRNREEKSRSHN